MNNKENATEPLPSSDGLSGLLCDVAQLLDGWHNDGTAWTEWDESVRQRVSEMQMRLNQQRRNDVGSLTNLELSCEAIQLWSHYDLGSRESDIAAEIVSRLQKVNPTEARNAPAGVVVEIIQGVEGSCMVINGERIAGTKPWGGGKVIMRWKVTREQIMKGLSTTTSLHCTGCGNEIDPDVCHCGDPMKSHSAYCGHTPVPIGCDCGRVGSEREEMGMKWWNAMSEPERAEVLRQAREIIPNPSAADAWKLWRANRISMEPLNCESSDRRR